jgi:hypothetical protein
MTPRRSWSCSGEQEAYLLEQGIEVVMKPFTIDALEGAVSRALELSEVERKPWVPQRAVRRTKEKGS